MGAKQAQGVSVTSVELVHVTGSTGASVVVHDEVLLIKWI